MEGLNKLKTGDFNYLNYGDREGDEVTVTLYKHGESHLYRFRVKDLYGENEEVLWEEEIEV